MKKIILILVGIIILSGFGESIYYGSSGYQSAYMNYQPNFQSYYSASAGDNLAIKALASVPRYFAGTSNFIL